MEMLSGNPVRIYQSLRMSTTTPIFNKLRTGLIGSRGLQSTCDIDVVEIPPIFLLTVSRSRQKQRSSGALSKKCRNAQMWIFLVNIFQPSYQHLQGSRSGCGHYFVHWRINTLDCLGKMKSRQRFQGTRNYFLCFEDCRKTRSEQVSIKPVCGDKRVQ